MFFENNFIRKFSTFSTEFSTIEKAFPTTVANATNFNNVKVEFNNIKENHMSNNNNTNEWIYKEIYG